MKLVETLRGNPPTNNSSFLKEYVDAHNNIGALEIDLENLEVAKDILAKGLKICDEEEVNENDDTRTRLHHNLGKKALELANSMEDEDALVKQIEQNITTVREAVKVMDELKTEEQTLKKLTRDMNSVRGTAHERKSLLKLHSLLQHLIEKSSMIFAWPKHREFAKQKKQVATQLCDKEMLGQSFLDLGESYQKIRDFSKANKWFSKSWEVSKLIGNLEGQASAKINIGGVQDSCGDWSGGLAAFEEGYRLAVEANSPSVQLSALENMHYSQMIRFQNAEEARRLQLEIDNLKQLKDREAQKKHSDCCSETDTEECDCSSDSLSSKPCSSNGGESFPGRSTSSVSVEELKEDVLLISLAKSTKQLPGKKETNAKKLHDSNNRTEASPKLFAKTASSQQTVGRKRVRVVLSDDEDPTNEKGVCLERKFHSTPVEVVATSDETDRKDFAACSSFETRDLSMDASKYAIDSSDQFKVEDIDFPYRSPNHEGTNHVNQVLRSVSGGETNIGSDSATSGSICGLGASDKLPCEQNTAYFNMHDLDGNKKRTITFNIANDMINFKAGSSLALSEFSIESLSIEVACLYYLQLPSEKRCKGLLPIIQHFNYKGHILESLDELEALNKDARNIFIEVSIDGWVQKRLMKLYIDCCNELSESPNINLLKKLYILEVEDEVTASECGLQDISIAPLLKALHTHKTVVMLDLSHNLLGNGTMEKLQQFFTSGQKYGDLTLDLHCNRFGPTALFQICECPVFFSRLEVLNISGNRLTDACGSYLSTILGKCKALYSLNIERCSITSRTIQKVVDAIHSDSVLAQLSIGHNPLTRASITNLLKRLSTLNSFAELDRSGLKLNKPAIDSLCELAKTSCLTSLSVGSTGIGNEWALQLTDSFPTGSQESLKLDLSYCTLTSACIHKLASNFNLACCIMELNLQGNPILPLGGNALVSLLKQPGCCLRLLVLNKCQLGLLLVLQLIQALAENDQLKELHVADNNDLQKNENPTSKKSPTDERLLDCQVNTQRDEDLVVADSEDSTRAEADASRFELNDTCTSSCRKTKNENDINNNNDLSSNEHGSMVKELSNAIVAANALQLLDLSRNGLSVRDVEALYVSWSAKGCSTGKHVEDEIVHFSAGTNKCCRKPCCRRE
ncbi:unnamed protein product [Linum trigynum]|uniref:Protein TONSOKU n=1 Tax=Linum trigynum TaxID=586398 RepID=A0AAV2ELF3_9ROSI